MEKLTRQLLKCPVIAAVRNRESNRLAIESPVAAIFLLGASIMELPELVQDARSSGKRVFLHMDLAEGLGRDDAAVRWSIEKLRVDGIISTRSGLLKTASEMGAITIQRLFLMDSSSFEHGKRLLKNTPPDMAEVLPGIAPKAIAQLCEALDKPVIAGGLVTQPHEIALALQAGALAVSAGDPKLWHYTL